MQYALIRTNTGTTNRDLIRDLVHCGQDHCILEKN